MTRLLFLAFLLPSLAFAANTDVKSFHLCDRTFSGSQTSYSATNFTLDQTTDSVNFMFECTEATTITQLCFNIGAKTTPPNMTWTLQGVSSSAVPDGSTKTGATVSFSPSGYTNGTLNCETLGSSYTCTRGEKLAAVLTIDAATGTVGVTYAFSGVTGQINAIEFPYAQTNDNTVVTKRDTGVTPFAWKSASKTYGLPINAFTSEVVDSSNTFALKFKVPSTLCSTFTLKGFAYSSFRAAGSGTQTFTLADGDATYDSIQDVAIDGDYFNVGNASNFRAIFDETTPTELTCGTDYRVAIASTAAMRVMSFTVPAAADMDAFPNGQDWTLSSRGAGDWTDTATKRLAGVCLVLDTITTPSQRMTGTTGGMQ